MGLIYENIQGGGTRAEREMLTNEYYRRVPRVFGSHAPIVMELKETVESEVQWIHDLVQMTYTSELLRVAMSLKDARTHELEQKLQLLEVDLTPVDDGNREYFEIKNYLMGSAPNICAKFTLEDVFRVSRPNERSRISASLSTTGGSSKRRLLWHGSRTTNFVGILREGLCIAPKDAPKSGWMYGKGAFTPMEQLTIANHSPHQAFTLLTLQRKPSGTVIMARKSFFFYVRSILDRMQG